MGKFVQISEDAQIYLSHILENEKNFKKNKGENEEEKMRSNMVEEWKANKVYPKDKIIQYK